MIRKIFLVVPLVIILSAQAVERLSVEVKCQLVEERYRVNLSPAQISEIEAGCAAGIAERLDESMRFLDFVAAESRPNRLLVRVGKPPGPGGAFEFRPIDLEIFVEGSDVTEVHEPIVWTYRELDEVFAVPSADTFADDIVLRFATEFANNNHQLVQEQLGTLRIADKALPIPQQKSWLLPFSREDFDIADQSELRIKAALDINDSEERFTYTVVLIGDFASAPGVPEEFHNKVKALHLGDGLMSVEDSIQRLRDAEGIEVLYVVVSRYVPSAGPDRVSPTDLDLDGDGGSP